MILRRGGGEGRTTPGLAGPVYPALLLATLSDQDKDWPHQPAARTVYHHQPPNQVFIHVFKMKIGNAGLNASEVSSLFNIKSFPDT